MGFAVQMIHWDTELCEQLADAGRYVIRFDNRDVGLSSKLDGQRAEPMAVLTAMLAGSPIPEVPYTLSDMSNDAIGLLDALGVDRSHVIGRVDGRDDRADDGHRAPGAIALGHVDHERDRATRMSVRPRPRPCRCC